MYLLDTSTLHLHAFFDPDVPYYAILSHRWEEGEVLYQDIRNGTAESKPGYAKVRGCCDLARSEGWDYVWLDSCCIDKASSVELSEAINSMFRWYEEAQVCYAYLSDVPHPYKAYEPDEDRYMTDFRESEWFTRGWTLQELLAPRTVVFYDKYWSEIGTRSSLENTIRSFTNINCEFTEFKSASVAQKMSWAALRQTTRLEDVAYCLLGLFDINMTTIYGEGWNAFTRLQLKILSTTHDESIFAWTEVASSLVDQKSKERGLLANSPAEFLPSANIRRRDTTDRLPSYSITNRGLRMEQQLLINSEELKIFPAYAKGLYVAVLNCSPAGSDDYLGVYLQRKRTDDDFVRVQSSQLITIETSVLEELRPRTRIVYVRQIQTPARGTALQHIFRVDMTSAYKHGYQRPLYEASRPIELSLPTESFYEHLLTYEAPLDEPTWVIYSFKNRKENDNFDVVLSHNERHVGVNIVAAPVRFDRSKKNFTTTGTGTSSPRHLRVSDRISQILPSGNSVSVTLRNGRDAGVQRYLITVSIDPDGDLPWPDGVGVPRPILASKVDPTTKKLLEMATEISETEEVLVSRPKRPLSDHAEGTITPADLHPSPIPEPSYARSSHPLFRLRENRSSV
jgi:hypothetical protein